MKINKEDILIARQSPGTIMRAQPNFGGMSISFNELPKGTDFSPLFQGLTHDSCHCPHWGYILEGSMLMKYDDGKEDLLCKGDVFYLPPGHTGIVLENIKFVDFSPTKEFNEVMNHIGKKFLELENS